jgi:hypothetical protein
MFTSLCTLPLVCAAYRADGADQDAAAAVGDVVSAALAPKAHCVNNNDLEMIMVSRWVRFYCSIMFAGAVLVLLA